MSIFWNLYGLPRLLYDKPFMMGEVPTTVDATIDAYVANILFVPIESPLKEFGLRQETLVAYCQRIRSRFYPEMNPLSHM